MNKSRYKEQVLELRNKNFTYTEISQIVGCSSSTAYYLCNLQYKSKKIEKARENISGIIKTKIRAFFRDKKSAINKNIKSSINIRIKQKLAAYFYVKGTNKTSEEIESKMNITYDELIIKMRENPYCYITGVKIDIDKPATYQLDHIIPRSRGGQNTVENMGLCTKEANQAKCNMTPDEFINFCKLVVEHNKNN